MMQTNITCMHAGRAFLLAAAAWLALGNAEAQLIGDKSPLKLIVPFAAGTPTDVIARTLSQELAKIFDRPVVVDNRPGAAGGIGTEHVANAAPDGQTMLLTVNSTITINPLLYGKLKYDPMKDLAPVALVASGGYLLVANPQVAYRDVAGLVRAAQAQPGSINYASYGAGSMSHMCAEVFQAMTNVRLFHVPYKSGSLNDILGGQIAMGFEPVGPAIPHVKAGKLVALAATAPKRIDALPTVPTLGEIVRGYDCTAWVGVLVPALTPTDVRKSLSDSIKKIVSTPEFALKMKEIGLEAQPGDQQQFTKLVRQDHEKWFAVTKPLNIRLD